MDHTKQSRNDNEPEQPQVEVFNSPVGSDYRQRRYHGSGRVLWGSLALFSGIILLFNNFNLVPWGIWNGIVRYWPVLLILAGFNVILGESLLAVVIMIPVSVTLIGLVFLLALVHTGSPIIGQLPQPLINIVDYLERFGL